MSGPVRPEVDPLDAAWVAAQAKAKVPADPLDAAWIHANLTPSDGNPLHAEYAKGLLANRMQRENENEQEQAANETLNPVQRGLVGIANTAGGIPGVEAAQAFAASKVNGIPYSEAYRDIKNAEGDLSGVGRFLTRGAGAAVAAHLLPGGAAAQGAEFGAASGLLNADPNAGIGHRIASGAGQAALGYGVGKLAEGATTLGRSLLARSPGKQAIGLKGAIREADAVNYPQAASEGTAAVNTPEHAAAVQELSKALQSPTTEEYTAAVLKSPRFANADAPTIAQEVYRQMSADQRMLGGRMAVDPTNFKAATGLKADDIAAAKKALLDAIDPVMPSFRQAVQEHAALAGEQGAAKTGSDAAGRIMRGAATPFKKLTTQGPEAVMQQLVGMKQGEAEAAKEALLARLKERALHNLTLNPLKGFGVPKALESGARLSPFVNAASQAAGGSGADAALQALLASLPSTQINR